MTFSRMWSSIGGNKLPLKKWSGNSVRLQFNILRRCVTNSAPASDIVNSTESEIYDKIIFNSVLQAKIETLSYHEKRRMQKVMDERRLEAISRGGLGYTTPICLRYLVEPEEKSAASKEDASDILKEELPVQFPYHVEKSYLDPTFNEIKSDPEDPIKEDKLNFVEEEESENKQWVTKRRRKSFRDFGDIERLKADVSRVEKELEEDSIPYLLQQGTSDPSIPVSSVPCGGCGALLHCQDIAIPGFLPKEFFRGASNTELRTLLCQRCHFLRERDFALDVNVKPEDYPKILREIENKRALVILMVDLIDFPCSIWPDICSIIGYKRPIVVVGNKIDLFVQDSSFFIQNVKDTLVDSLSKTGISRANIKHVALISARTGYGVEELISVLQENWSDSGDIYIVGCTNVGKSTLFNSLIQSDLCKTKAADILQRATVSRWPGTTLNLLKFPVLKPASWRLHLRKLRLKDKEGEVDFTELARQNELRWSHSRSQIPLAGAVGRTFAEGIPLNSNINPFSVTINAQDKGVQYTGLDPDDSDFVHGRWCFDTPGVVHHDQILHILTTEELIKTLPTSLILPINVRIQAGHTFFIGGLARFDYISGPHKVWFSIFTSSQLPVTLTKTKYADEVYEKLLGTDLFAVPTSGKDRLSKWPALKSKQFKVSGKYNKCASGDVVLSSAGWVSVTLLPAEHCTVQAWTPEGRGLHLRNGSVIQKAWYLRGNKYPGTPVYKTNIVEVDEESDEENSQ